MDMCADVWTAMCLDIRLEARQVCDKCCDGHSLVRISELLLLSLLLLLKHYYRYYCKCATDTHLYEFRNSSLENFVLNTASRCLASIMINACITWQHPTRAQAQVRVRVRACVHAVACVSAGTMAVFYFESAAIRPFRPPGLGAL